MFIHDPIYPVVYAFVVIGFGIIFSIFYFFRKQDKLINIFEKYREKVDKIEGPFGILPDFFAFIAYCFEILIKIFIK
ncbi:hypothetical protein ABM34_06470 [Companilactobacillus ginsenosidimutans]|uniref:Uncharacterized protein n=1 Tax=Companilactobacillus ginsenosidimutans TaxID=1007676 RepID=A0A0H4QFM4_9LACO|nr:hypothetical protein ABM34_06470 [Companilactobacillus ginsenosidimutans]